jgi:hypothetical protein
MSGYFGIIEIDILKNKYDSAVIPESLPPLPELKQNDVRFIHYPDCQQLCIWLPLYGRDYDTVKLRDNNTLNIIQDRKVTDLLSGSIQLVWDTLFIPPGDYTIEITWKAGWQHLVHIIKLKEEEQKPVVTTITPKPVIEERRPDTPIVYRDGYGKIIPNEDELLREQLRKDLRKKFGPYLEYDGNFRGGNIIYIDKDLQIRFPHEMGGGNCMFYIDIPSEKCWEAQTKTSLSRRKEILDFLCRQVQIEQASNCNYVIEETVINFYYK